MKKPILLTLIALIVSFLVSCNNQDGLEMCEIVDDVVMPQEYITSNEAIALALKAKNHYYGKDSRSSFSVEKVRAIGGHQSRSDGNEPLLYIVDFEDNEGCAVICGKRIDDPVLAVTECGSLEYNSNGDNPGAQFFMERALAYVDTKVPQPIDTTTVKMQYWEERTDTLAYWNIPQRVNLAWHQHYPFNQFCPIDAFGNQAPTGCGPLTAAMIMTYFGHPDYIDLTFPDSNSERLIFDWDGMRYIMPANYVDLPPIDLPFEDYEEMAAKLIREIGNRSGALYFYNDNDTTYVTKSDFVNFIKSQGYSCRTSSSMPSLSEDKDEIIVVFGRSSQFNHIFFIDGQDYIQAQDVEVVYEEIRKGVRFKLYETVLREYSHNYVHVNWGWGGIDNGYYNAGVLSTNSIVKPDNTPTYGDGGHLNYSVSSADYVIISK